MLVLVTGGAGFIGSHIVDRLLADGHEVRVLDDFSTGKRENLQKHQSLKVISGDVGDFDTVKQVMERVEWVFHEAAVASVQKSIEDPIGTQKTNYQGTLNVLESARQCGTKRVVFAASAAAYGDLPELPKQEDMHVKPLSQYAIDKLASEYTCQFYYRIYGVETVCLRYFNVYGPRQDPSSPYSGVISIFEDALKSGKDIKIYGDGEQTRDFVFIEDAVEANIKAMTTKCETGIIINIATGHQCTLNDLLKIMCNITGVNFTPNYEPARQGDIRYSYADITRAEQIIAWKPTIKLEQGLQKYLNAP